MSIFNYVTREPNRRKSWQTYPGTQGHRNAPPMAVAAAGAEFAYREFGPQSGVPLVALTHLGANLDSWDPRSSTAWPRTGA